MIVITFDDTKTNDLNLVLLGCRKLKSVPICCYSYLLRSYLYFHYDNVALIFSFVLFNLV